MAYRAAAACTAHTERFAFRVLSVPFKVEPLALVDGVRIWPVDHWTA